MVPLDKELQWLNVKRTLFRYIIQTYSETCETVAYFRTVIYPEPWHIQNQKHIQNLSILRTLAYSKSEAYSEPCQTSTIKCFAKIVNGYNYFHNL